MFKKINIIIPSTHSDDEMKEFISMIKNTCNCEHEIYFITNKEGIGLAQLYSDVMNKIKDEVFVFIHDDIVFLKSGWGAEVLRLFNENEDYGIIGVAGSKEFNEQAMWWTNKKCYGQVMHENDGQKYLTQYSPLLKQDLEEVCVIDGLFIAVAKNRLGSDFDKSINGFHFYDITFCLDNYLSGWCKIGVTTNIRILHKSVGKLNQRWFDNREIINLKYKKHYPIRVK